MPFPFLPNWENKSINSYRALVRDHHYNNPNYCTTLGFIPETKLNMQGQPRGGVYDVNLPTPFRVWILLLSGIKRQNRYLIDGSPVWLQKLQRSIPEANVEYDYSDYKTPNYGKCSVSPSPTKGTMRCLPITYSDIGSADNLAEHGLDLRDTANKIMPYWLLPNLTAHALKASSRPDAILFQPISVCSSRVTICNSDFQQLAEDKKQETDSKLQIWQTSIWITKRFKA